jgi:hypothetical protein
MLARIKAFQQSGFGGELAFDTNTGTGTPSDTTERMRIDHNGNVGIGKSNPSFLLDVNGVINATDIYRNGASLSTYVDDKLKTKADTTYVDGKLSTKADTTYVDNKLNNKAALGGSPNQDFQANALTAGTLKFSNSTVLIKSFSTTLSSAPQDNLQIVGPPSFDSSTILHVTNGATNFGRTNLVLTGRFYDRNDGWNFGTWARNSLVFSMNSNNPNVGVGGLGEEKFSIQLEGNSNSLGFLTKQLASSPALVIQQNGNVGIGTTTPQATLDVNGDLCVKDGLMFMDKKMDMINIFFVPKEGLWGGQFGYGDGSGNSTVDFFCLNDPVALKYRVQIKDNGVINCIHFHETSDLCMKEDIEELHYGLQQVKKLRPIMFNWKTISNPHKSLGLIAQEVAPVIQEVVYMNNNAGGDGSLSIAYTNLIPVLINAIKQLDSKISSIAEFVGCRENPSRFRQQNTLTAKAMI